MCGIAGWLATPGHKVDRELLRGMSAAIAHRGPDDAGEYLDPDGGIGLAFRRLAIIDLSPASAQPMVDRARGLVLVYNGELYNFQALRAELVARGHQFATRGDTEVVLRAYAEWEEGCFERFAGMFALAIWDAQRSRLVCARDALGIKPLYLLDRAEGLLFASEIKAFCTLPWFRRELDPGSLAQYLELGYVFEPQRTMLRGVTRLAPGEVLIATRGAESGAGHSSGHGLVRRRFRHFVAPLPDPAANLASRPMQRVEELGAVLEQVVSEHLIADVPVGLLLSGGIDSSLIAAYAARQRPISTVTMAFAESTIDEREPARLVANYLGTDHHEIEIQPQEIVDEVSDGAWVFDDLFDDWGTLSTRMLYRRFRGLGFKVALVGEGADELFAGYPKFDNTAGPATLWRRFQLYRRYSGRRWGPLFRDFNAALDGMAITSTHQQSVASELELFELVRHFEVERQLPANYVMKVDKAAMSVSLEARTPFLDRRVAELALRTPRELLQRDGENKWLLRELARSKGLLPPEAASRPKFGASIAVSWIEQVPKFRSFARDVVLAPGAWCDQLGLRGAMTRFFRGRGGYPPPHPLSILSHLAWRLLLLELWATRYLAPVPGSPEGQPLEKTAVVPPATALLGPDRDGDTVVMMAPSAVEIAAPSPASAHLAALPVQVGLVSVIVPVHNRPTLLREAIASVLAQTYRPIEILIVDDGSTDDTPSVAAELAANHPDVVRVLRRSQGGPGLARETGRREARGEYLQYLDSDDRLAQRKLELQVAALDARPGASLAFGTTQFFTSDGAISVDPQSADRALDRLFPSLLRGRLWQTGAALIRRSASDAVGPWSDLWLYEDWEYEARIAALDLPVVFVPESLTQIRKDAAVRLGGGLWNDPWRLSQQARAHELIYEHAAGAKIPGHHPELAHFARALFLMARHCGAAGLSSESGRLFGLARRLSSLPGARRPGDLIAYRLLAAGIGWRSAGRFAVTFDRWRGTPANGNSS